MRTIDLTGKRFGNRQVLSRHPKTGQGAYWVCRCDCGTEQVVSGCSLRRGLSSSCGCGLTKRKPRIHGKTNTREHNAWLSMRKRCTQKSWPGFHRYGGRGITFCERWNVFQNFLDDMGLCPDGHSLDRIDVNGNYEPSNCQWATRDEQFRNRRISIYITIKGERVYLNDAAKRAGLSHYVVRSWRRRGLDVEKMLLEAMSKNGVTV